ncbi:hypothetical protein CJ030_MR6G010435 [Morella rubra]|uniref:Uncharacterized protein n=1 Tax=Morella rubra TaxID=262757 RepID=A0A6A1VAC0_9ROSI|nr:hypothetical protein CJ030_MR6G010435 [Morella rubra]
MARKAQPEQPLSRIEVLATLLDDKGRGCGDDDDDDNIDDEGEVKHFAPSPQTMCILSRAELRKSLNGMPQEMKVVRGKIGMIIPIRRPPD